MFTARRVWQPALALALVALGAWSAVGAADPKFLPSDTEIVFTLNVRQILESELIKSNPDALKQAKAQLENQASETPVLKYLKDAGFDIFRDLGSLTVANNGSKEPTAIVIE